MNFKIKKELLLYGLNNVTKAITGKAVLPLLEGIYIESNTDNIVLRGSDNDIFIQTTLKADVESKGSIVVSANILLEIIKKLPNDIVHIYIENNMLTIKCKKTLYNIVYMPSTDYPTLPTINKESSILLPQKVIKNMVKGTSFSASLDDSRPILQGIYFDLKDGTLNMVALDGYRLANTIESVDDNDINCSFVVESKNFQEIARMFDMKGDVRISNSENYVLFEFGDTVVYSRLLQGAYIKYKDLIPHEFKTFVVVDRVSFINSIERASLVNKSEKSNLIKLEIDSSNLTVTSNSQLGKVKEELESETDGDSLTISFNSRYLLDVLKVIEDKDIVLKLNNSISPCLVETDTYKYLLLPVRMI